MKITIETEERAEISTQTTTAVQTLAPVDGGASAAALTETETVAMLAPSPEKTTRIDAGQPPSWLVEAIESAASPQPAISEEKKDAGSGPSE